MNQKHLLRFIKKKMRDSAQEVVINSKGVKLTLSQVSKEGVVEFSFQICLVRGEYICVIKNLNSTGSCLKH